MFTNFKLTIPTSIMHHNKQPTFILHHNRAPLLCKKTHLQNHHQKLKIPTMIDHKTINEFAEKLSAAIPDGAKTFQKDLEKNLRSLLNHQFEKMALVTREELEIQRDVLSHTREKLDKLETRLNELEQQLNDSKTKD